jgi:integration host factor subunit beta
MVKQELIRKMTEQSKVFYEKDVERSVRTIINALSDALSKGERIEIRGFGSFYIKKYGQREAMNPQTGEKVKLNNRRIPHFRISKVLHERLNIDKA